MKPHVHGTAEGPTRSCLASCLALESWLRMASRGVAGAATVSAQAYDSTESGPSPPPPSSAAEPRSGSRRLYACTWHTGSQQRFKSRCQRFDHLEQAHGLRRASSRWNSSGCGARTRRRESRWQFDDYGNPVIQKVFTANAPTADMNGKPSLRDGRLSHRGKPFAWNGEIYFPRRKTSSRAGVARSLTLSASALQLLPCQFLAITLQPPPFLSGLVILSPLTPWAALGPGIPMTASGGLRVAAFNQLTLWISEGNLSATTMRRSPSSTS